jgi:hypothetical protein
MFGGSKESSTGFSAGPDDDSSSSLDDVDFGPPVPLKVDSGPFSQDDGQKGISAPATGSSLRSSSPSSLKSGVGSPAPQARRVTVHGDVSPAGTFSPLSITGHQLVFTFWQR